MNPFNVLERPLLSEKSNGTREKLSKYTFQIHIDATKGDVKNAVEKVFGVKVATVKTLVTRGKIKRRGNNLHKQSNKKKAVVTLVEGGKISLFEEL